MTTLFPKTVKCAKCGTSTEVTIMGSTNAFGSMDLDMRPPPMERHTLDVQIQQCGACGFCAPDIEDGEGVDMAQVGLSAYNAVLEDARFPSLAGRFRAYSQMASAANSPVRACWAAMRAAWACDDSGGEYRDAAIACRKQALQALDRIHGDGQTFSADRETDEILRLDLLRRAGEFQSAMDAAARLRTGPLPDILDRLAAFQARQAERKDPTCFKVEFAMKQ